MTRLLPGLLTFALLLPALPALADEVHPVGKEMGYRLFGEGKKNRVILAQNSRPTAVEIFDEARGLFVTVPGRSDVELACKGQDRLLKVRFRDSFRESVPFQTRVACGREIQFVDPAQFASRALPAAPVAVDAPAATAPSLEGAAGTDMASSLSP